MGAAARNELAALGQLVNVSGLSAGGATFVKDGSVLIVAEDDIRLGNSIYTDGADYHLTANKSIVVGEDVVVSTRDVADPANANHETAASEGDSGDLKLLASHIELQRGAKLLAHADNGPRRWRRDRAGPPTSTPSAPRARPTPASRSTAPPSRDATS